VTAGNRRAVAWCAGLLTPASVAKAIPLIAAARIAAHAAAPFSLLSKASLVRPATSVRKTTRPAVSLS
jgi:hypothetical protein